jgi:uncharacterized membrane protein (DUF2068 family)
LLAVTDDHSAVVTKHPLARRRALRSIAAFEAIKGVAALALLIGVLDLMHRDVGQLALELIGHFGLNPEAHYPALLLQYAAMLSDINPLTLVVLGLAYITIRLAEAYGLWHDKAWAEWLAALSGALYLPFELEHLRHRPTLTSTTVVVANVFVVGFMVYQLWQRGRLSKSR